MSLYSGSGCRLPYSWLLKKEKQNSSRNYSNLNEFLAFEILNAIGFCAVPHSNNIITIEKLLPKKSTNSHSDYQLDTKFQDIFNVKNLESYKISGNLFASKIGAILVGSAGFEADGSSMGLIRTGDRFIAVINSGKNPCLGGKGYQALSKTLADNFAKAKLYQNTLEDQEIYIIRKIEKALESGTFDKIFSVKSIKKAHYQERSYLDFSSATLKEKRDQFKENARSIVKFFKDKNPDIFNSFDQRETIRESLADIIIKQLFLQSNGNIDISLIKAIILEDLRGPYYAKYFITPGFIQNEDLENTALISALVKDQAKELNAANIVTLPGLMEHIKRHISTELARMQGNEYFKKKEALQMLLVMVNSINFYTAPIDKQKEIIKYLMRHLDIVFHEHVRFFHRAISTSEKNWSAFKIKHCIAIRQVDPNLSIGADLKKIKSKNFQPFFSSLKAKYQRKDFSPESLCITSPDETMPAQTNSLTLQRVYHQASRYLFTPVKRPS